MAKYCAKYMPDYIKNLDEYKKCNMEEALRLSLIKFDETLTLTTDAKKELKNVFFFNLNENNI